MDFAPDRVWRLENPIQHYAWGSRTAIAELCGRRVPSPHPEAELWIGAHPKAPSMVPCKGQSMGLNVLIDRYPDDILGEGVARRFGPRLPFLFKVLAAAAPLSIQAHPDQDQAREGFERENRAGIPLDAPQRNYRDDNHKPEVICALTPFVGLNGFRPMDDLGRQAQRFCPAGLAAPLDALRSVAPREGLQGLLDHLLALEGPDRDRLIDEALQSAANEPPRDPIVQWLHRLRAAYPGDIGILTPIILNLVRLEPGQAMYLPAGQLHAYLEGVGIELMANSDNVLRGGLTPKHVDRKELLRVLRFAPCDPGVMQAEPLLPTEARFPTPAPEFSLAVITVSPAAVHVSARQRNVEILLVTSGTATLAAAGADDLRLNRGQSVLVPAAAGPYQLRGQAQIFKASVPETHA